MNVCAKNASMHTDIASTELLDEVSELHWDIILFSERWRGHTNCHHHGGHRFARSARCKAAGVAFLLHDRHAKKVLEHRCDNDRLMYLVFLI